MRLLERCTAVAFVTFLCLAQPRHTWAEQANPAFPLKLGAPGTRYLVDRNDAPFFWAGDAAWSLIAQLSEDEVLDYLDDRKAKGFSVVMVNAIEHAFASNAPENFYHQAPFTGAAFSSVPNEEYFKHVDFVIEAAAERGMLVLLAPLYLGFNCGHEGWCREIQSASRADMREWGRYIGARYARFDNIVYMMGGDTDPSPVRAKVVEVVTGIREADPNRLMTAHNQPGSFAVDPWAGQSWLTVNNFYVHDQSERIYSKARAAYARTPVMPFFQVESFYENEDGGDPLTLRKQAYGSLLNGAFGEIFGSCPIWHFGSNFDICDSNEWRAGLNREGSLQMQYLHTLFRSRAWHLLVPDVRDSIVTAGAGTFGDPDFVTAASTSDGTTIVAYLPSARAVTLDLSALNGTNANAWWLDPRTGTATRIGTFAISRAQSFAPPGAGDWVLVVDAASADLPAPGNESQGGITYIGNSEWSRTYSEQNDFTNFFRFTAPSNMSIDTMEVLVQSGSGGRIEMAVYSDRGGVPGSLLATSGQVASAVTGWNAASLSETLALAGGSAYWLALNTDSATLQFAYTPGVGTVHWQVRNFSSPWPESPDETEGPVTENWAIRAYRAQ